MSAPIVIAELRKNARQRLRIAIDQWQGHTLLDIRVTAQISEATDVWTETKKGVSVNVALIPALREALAEAEERARELGLIGGEA